MQSREMRKIDRDLSRLMERYGFEEKRRSGGHIIWINREGKVTTTSATPSDHRALKQIEGLLKSY